jgi:beta-galactosidase
MLKRILIYCALFFSGLTAANAQTVNHTFALGDSTFLLDGKPLQMISGEMHYTRIPREYWRERMKMAKAMGLNTIGTYVFGTRMNRYRASMILPVITILPNLYV